MTEFNIPQIDLVIVDLYPFEKTVASGASESDIIEKSIVEQNGFLIHIAQQRSDIVCAKLAHIYAIN